MARLFCQTESAKSRLQRHVTDHEDFFDEFEPHTRLKHVVLRAYLRSYAMKLLQSGHERVWFLDGFAGAGADRTGNPGSPLIAVRTADDVDAELGAKGKRLGTIFIEKDPSVFKRLTLELAPFRGKAHQRIVTLEGQYAERCPEALGLIGNEPRLAFLDPFGLKGLDATTYRPLLSGVSSEVFMLVADAGATRMSGVIHVGEADFARVTERILAQPSLFAGFDDQDRMVAERELAARQAQVAATAEGIRRLLREALGPEAAERVSAMTPAQASEELLARLADVLREAGALYITQFRVRDVSGLHKYVLMHATTSPVGVVTMKESISGALSTEVLPLSLRDQLRRDLWVDVSKLVDDLGRIREGRTQLWAKDADGSLQRELLVHTPLFPHQAGEVKAELKRRGWFARNTERKDAVKFPARGGS